MREIFIGAFSDCSLLRHFGCGESRRVYFDGKHGVSVTIGGLADGFAAGYPHEIGDVIKYAGRRQKNESKDNDADEVVLN
jgi:hypothetical protein